MSRQLKPYPSYQDSPVPWLDKVPSGWSAVRLDRLFKYRNEEPLPTDDRVTGYLDGRVTLRSNVAGQKIKGVVHETGWQRIHVGDFAISGMNAHLGGMGVSDSDGKCSPIYLVLEPRPETNAHFVSLAVRHAAHLGAIKALVQTIRFNSSDMKRADLKSIYVPLPPTDDQEQIVRFIRHLDQRVNRLIKAKRRLIELLNEQKQAIIHRAVTRGLDSTVPLKPSGIDWLGDINASWQVLRSKYLFKEVDERSVDGTEEHLSMSQVHGLIPSSKVSEKRLVSESYAGGKICREGDLVLNRLKAHLGVFALAPMLGVISPDYTVLRPIADIEDRFFELVYRTPACRVELAKRAKGIVQGFWRLYTDDFYCIGVPVPPRTEQIQILEWLDIELKTLNDAIQKSFAEIDLIREFRTRLVADVVTGQLDVRNLDLSDAEDLVGLIDEGELEDLDELEETEE